jgi:hypothetical protein
MFSLHYVGSMPGYEAALSDTSNPYVQNLPTVNVKDCDKKFGAQTGRRLLYIKILKIPI